MCMQVGIAWCRIDALQFGNLTVFVGWLEFTHHTARRVMIAIMSSLESILAALPKASLSDVLSDDTAD
jgi:hypothetical protein